MREVMHEEGKAVKLRVHVGEACELALVDVGNDQLVGRGQDGLRTCEKLVEVFCSFATLKEISAKKRVRCVKL